MQLRTLGVVMWTCSRRSTFRANLRCSRYQEGSNCENRCSWANCVLELGQWRLVAGSEITDKLSCIIHLRSTEWCYLNSNNCSVVVLQFWYENRVALDGSWEAFRKRKGLAEKQGHSKNSPTRPSLETAFQVPWYARKPDSMNDQSIILAKHLWKEDVCLRLNWCDVHLFW